MSPEGPVLSLGCHVLVFSHEGSGRYKSTLVSYASVTSELAGQMFLLPFSHGQGHRAPPNSLLALSGVSKNTVSPGPDFPWVFKSTSFVIKGVGNTCDMPGTFLQYRWGAYFLGGEGRNKTLDN